MCVDHAGEWNSGLLPLRSFHQKIVIHREEEAVQRFRPVEQLWISRFGTAVFECREHVDTAEPQSQRNRPRDVLVHVIGQGHGSPSGFEAIEKR